LRLAGKGALEPPLDVASVVAVTTIRDIEPQ
jgi:hypothetical protein